jgi:hypothetical protein
LSLFGELKRRNVFRVGVAYVVASWILIQVADTLISMLGLPDWAPKLVLLILLIGFIPALIFAWAFELTPEGIKRDSEIDRSGSVTSVTARKLNHVIVVLLVAAVAYLLFDKFSGSGSEAVSTPAADRAEQAVQPETVSAPEPEPSTGRQSIAVLPFDNRSRS